VIFRIFTASWRILGAICVDPLASLLLALIFLVTVIAVGASLSLIEKALHRRTARRAAPVSVPSPRPTPGLHDD